jgi:hypothetical protein
MGKTIRERGVVRVPNKFAQGGGAIEAKFRQPLDLRFLEEEHFTVLVSRAKTPGTKEGTRRLRKCSNPRLPPQL